MPLAHVTTNQPGKRRLAIARPPVLDALAEDHPTEHCKAQRPIQDKAEKHQPDIKHGPGWLDRRSHSRSSLVVRPADEMGTISG
jgi:hypothetical protein